MATADPPAPLPARGAGVVGFLTVRPDPQQQGAMVANVGWLLAVSGAHVLVVDWESDGPSVTEQLQRCPALPVPEWQLGKAVVQAQNESFPRADQAGAKPSWLRYEMAGLVGRIDVATFPDDAPVSAAHVERFCGALADAGPYHYILLNGSSRRSGDGAEPSPAQAVALGLATVVVLGVDEQPDAIHEAQALVTDLLKRTDRSVEIIAVAADWDPTRASAGAMLHRQLAGDDPAVGRRIRATEIEYDRRSPGRLASLLTDNPANPALTTAYRRICALVGASAQELSESPPPAMLERYAWALGRRTPPRPFWIAYLPPDRLQAERVAHWLQAAVSATIQPLPLIDRDPGAASDADQLWPGPADTALVIGSANLRPGDRRIPDEAIWILDDATDRAGESGGPRTISLYSVPKHLHRVVVLARLGLFLDIPSTRSQDAGSLGERTSPLTRSLIPERLNPPDRDPRFVGRDRLLEQVRDIVAPMPGTNARASDKPVVLTGEPGIGKSGIAAEYAHRFGQDYGGVLWIVARDQRSVRAALADFYRAQGGDATTHDLAEAALQRFRSEHWANRWLLIFDNVDGDALKGIGLDRLGHVIITAERRPDALPQDGVQVIQVGQLEMHESWQFLRQPDVGVTGLSDEEATTVATLLGGLPVPLTVAAAYLREKVAFHKRNTTAEQAHERAVEELLEGLDLEQPGTDLPTRVLAMACEELGHTDVGRLAVTLAEMCAFLAPEGVSLALVLRSRAFTAQLAADGGTAGELLLADETQFEWVLALGARFGLYDLDWSRQGKLRMHRVLQQGMAELLERKGQQNTRRAGVLSALAELAPIRTSGPDSAPLWEELRQHFVRSGAPEVDRLEPGPASPGRPGTAGWAVRRWVVEQISYVRRVGQPADRRRALELATELSGRWEDAYGHDDLLRLRLVDQHAGLLMALDRNTEALAVDQAVLADFRRTLEPNHPRTLLSGSGFAADLQRMGRFEEALDEQLTVWRHFRGSLGEDHPDTLREGNNLAILYFRTGQHGEALTLQRDCHMRRVRVLGEQDRWSLVSMRDLGIYLSANGQHDEALELLTKAEQLRQPRESPNDDPEDLRVAKALAVVRRRSGVSPKELARQGSKLLEEHRIRLVEDHPYTLAAQLNHAVELKCAGKAHKAVDLSADCLGRTIGRFGRAHPFVAIVRANHAVILLAAEQDGPAMSSAQQAIEEFTEHDPSVDPSHPWVLAATVNLARMEAVDGNRARAYQMLQDVQRTCLTDLGEQHPITVATTENLAAAGDPEGIHAAAVSTSWIDIDIDMPLV